MKDINEMNADEIIKIMKSEEDIEEMFEIEPEDQGWTLESNWLSPSAGSNKYLKGRWTVEEYAVDWGSDDFLITLDKEVVSTRLDELRNPFESISPIIIIYLIETLGDKKFIKFFI